MSNTLANVTLKHLVRDRDRHGNVRIYVRLPGQAKVRIRAEEGSEAFFDAYRAAIAGDTVDSGKPTPRPKRPRGTIGALLFHYECSGDYRDLGSSTKAARKRILDKMDRSIGAFLFADLTPLHIKTWRDNASGPEAGNSLVKTLRKVFAVAQEDALIKSNPAKAVKYRRGRPGGWTPWDVHDVERFIKRHPRGTPAYKALCLFLFTGARVSDVRRMGPQHERNRGSWLHFTQHKGRNRSPIIVDVPIVTPLRDALEQCPSDQMAYMTSSYGRPFRSDRSFGNWFAKRVAEAGIEGKSAHGIRKGLGDILAEIGCTAHQIMAILGHTTLKQAENYTRLADRKRMAGAGMAHLETALRGGAIMPVSDASKSRAERT
ncbi:MAG: integrase [Maricaulis maris]|jgi:integrase